MPDCFSDVPKNDYKNKCRRGIQSAVIADTRRRFTEDIDPYLDEPDDKDIDCILFNRMSDPEERNSTFSLSLIPEIGQRRKKSLFERQDPSASETRTKTRRAGLLAGD